MTNDTQKQDDKIHYLYRITNKINQKIYIGQTVQPNKRWNQHRHDAINPTQVIHHAINKYGIINFEFEVIALCKSQNDANLVEEELIKQYNCLVKDGEGYNISLGGIVAAKSDEWKRAMKEWHVSLSPEERAERSQKIREATIKQISEKGHPAQGTKRTPEQSARLSKARKEHPVEYTNEIRQHMSESHIGKIFPKEQRQKMAEAIKEQWKIRGNYDSKKCEAPNCDIAGKAKYKIINNIRYCEKHGLRMRRYGRLERLRYPIYLNKN